MGNLVTANFFSGTLVTAAQPNITSVGNLTSLTVTGNVTANLFGPLANGTSSVKIAAANGNVTITAVGNTTMTITGTGANISGTANITGNVSAPFFLGNGSQLTGIVASTAGTVTTNAQPAITSVGTLTSLGVSGNLVANIIGANLITLKSYTETVLSPVNTGTAITPNVANGTIFNYTANANFTFNGLTGATTGTSATIIIKQDATGSRIMTSTMKFAGNSKTLSTAAASTDIISVLYDGSAYYATLSKGYE